MREYMAAQSAMQVHLPQDQRSRITFSMAAVGSNTGIGAGYAYMLDPTVPDDVIRSQDYARQQQQIDFLQEQSQQYRVELSEIEKLKEDAAKLKRQLQEDADRRKQVLDRYNKKGGV
jgi:hypothetical protein